MKKYKVETLAFHPKMTFESGYMARESKEGIQEKLDEYSKNGYILTSKDIVYYEASLYVYLFFEKDV